MTNDTLDPSELEQLAAELLLEFDDEKFDLPQSHWDAKALRQAPMSEVDDAALIMSPRNRMRFDEAIARARAVFFSSAANFNHPVAVAAASSGARDIIRFNDELLRDFSLVMRPSGQEDWLVFCELKRGNFPLESTLEIRDQTGRVWLSGKPDENGQLVGLLQSVDDPRGAAKKGLLIFIDDLPLGSEM